MVKHIVSKANAIGSRAAGLSLSWRALLLSLLLLSVLMSALTVVYSAFLYRQAFNAQQQMFQRRDALQVEWGQLLLEQSALAAHSRIEKKLTQLLDMYVPAPNDIVVVR